MAYTINKTDGSILATISDGSINTDSSLTLFGFNFAGWGEFLNENLVRLLESGANTSAPVAPLIGELWYDKSNSVLKIYDGTEFKGITAISTDTTAPTTGNVIGHMWFDPVNKQLNVYDGADFLLVGPAFTAGTGISGAIVDTITDSLAVDHVVIMLYAENNIVGIVSKDATFTPASSIPGFATINPGIQLATSIGSETPQFTGTATDSDSLGGFASTSYLRSDANDTTSGSLGVLNDSGLTIGADSDILIDVSPSYATLRSVTANNNLRFQVNDGVGNIDGIVIDGTTGVSTIDGLTVTNLSNLNGGIAVDTTAFTVADTTGNTAIAGTLDVTGLASLDGGIAVDANFTVDGTTGATTIAGSLNANGGISVDSTAFTVADTTGNVSTTGTLDVTGNATLSSGALLPDGSAATPAIRFSSETNTGIARASAGDIALVGAGVTIATFTNDAAHDMGGKRLSNGSDPIAGTDFATKNYADTASTISYGTEQFASSSSCGSVGKLTVKAPAGSVVTGVEVDTGDGACGRLLNYIAIYYKSVS